MAHKHADSMIAIMRKMAQLYRDEIRAGLNADEDSPEAVDKARIAIPELLNGERIKLERGPVKGSLYAVFKMQRLALLGRQVRGSGGRLRDLSAQNSTRQEARSGNGGKFCRVRSPRPRT
jgi:hypothetical protein